MSIALSGTISHSDPPPSRKKIRVCIPRSSSTLYVGAQCNDGRPIQESWKYKRAVALGIPIIHVGDTPFDWLEKKEEQEEEPLTTKDPVTKKDLLWADKYRPRCVEDVIGHRSEIQQLRTWLQQWDHGIPKTRGVFVSGPPGIGKTTTLHLLCSSLGYAVTEYNASDSRSVSTLRGMFLLGFKRLRKEVIIMDEVDGLSERGGVGELATIFQQSMVPMFAIANERPPKLKPLLSACLEIRFSRPMRSTIAAAMDVIAKKEGIVIPRTELETMCETNGNDIRALLNQLMFYGRGSNSGQGDKDTLHRMEPFSVTQRLFAQKKMSWNDATELVFVDYHLVPLMIQEAYIHAGQDDMAAIADAADDLSGGDIMSRRVYQTQDWSLVPHVVNRSICAVKTVPGRAPFQIFPQLLGKMSKQRKQAQWMKEMARRVTRGYSSQVMRLDYAEPLRLSLSRALLTSATTATTLELIQQMDTMGLTRDDLFDALEDTAFVPIAYPTKIKAAFTREWNKSHGSEIVKKRVKGAKKVSKDSDKEEKEDKDKEDQEEDNEEEEQDQEWDDRY